MAFPSGNRDDKKRKDTMRNSSPLKKPRVTEEATTGNFKGKWRQTTDDENYEQKPLLDRAARKEAAEIRKMNRRPNYELEKNVVVMWEKLRVRNIEDAERSRLVSSILSKIKGKLLELAVSHTSSRILQACVKHCNNEERAAIFEELRPHCVALARNTYAHHLVNKMLDSANKEQRQQILSQFHGQTLAFLRHPSASQVLEHSYQLANGTEKAALVSEFYSPEFRIFKGIATQGKGRLVDILADSPQSKKRAILEHMALALQPILEKGIVDHSIVHRALDEFLVVAPQSMGRDVVEHLAGPLLLRMLHTRSGALVACKCVAAGSAKERKKIVKGFKEHVAKVARDDHGHLVLLQILEVIDDTLLVRKTILSEVVKEVLPLSLHKYGSRIFLHLLAPHVRRYFPADVISVLQSNVGSAGKETKATASADEENGTNKTEEENKEEDEEEGGLVGASKKDPEVRRWELLHDSKLDAELTAVCTTNTGELLRSQFGTDVIYEVASGGVGGVLWKSMAASLPAVHQAIADLAALPRPEALPSEIDSNNGGKITTKSKKRKKVVGEVANAEDDSDPKEKAATEGSEAKEKELHVLDDFFANRTIRRLVQDAPLPPEETGAKPFAAVLWERALSGRCHLWANGHGAKVVVAVAKSSHEPTRKAAMAELRPLVKSGTLSCVQQWLPLELLQQEENTSMVVEKRKAPKKAVVKENIGEGKESKKIKKVKKTAG